MTSPTAGPAPTRSENIIQWFETNQRFISIATAVLIVAAGAYWFVQRTHSERMIAASKGLSQAENELQGSGNIQLAQSDLQRMVKDYSGTFAGTQGAMLLAQTDYDQGKFADGIGVLQTALGKAPTELVSEINDLIGSGNMGLNKPAEAAKAFEAAAAATNYSGEKASERSKAATAYLAAHDTAKAKAIWTDLANDLKNPGSASEAQVRLGELNAKVAGRG